MKILFDNGTPNPIPVALHVRSSDPEIRTYRERLAVRVCEYFAVSYPFPEELHCLCYLDDRDVVWLKQNWGGHANRGFHWPIRGQGLRDWPQDMWDTIASVDAISGVVSWPYASVVYLHGSTCESDIQLAMTLSHELQHFLQFASDRQLWAIHTLMSNIPNLPTDDLRHWYDLPNEREARIVAKHVAEDLFGRAEVDKHISKMIAARLSEEDVADWHFIQGIDSSQSCDLRRETIPIVAKYREQLEQLKRTKFAKDKDLGSVDLNL